MNTINISCQGYELKNLDKLYNIYYLYTVSEKKKILY